MQIYVKPSTNGSNYVRAEGKFDFPASLVADYALGKISYI